MEEQKKEEKLRMTFSPNTIEHLGVRLYSTVPPVIAEIVANSYDADAKEVHIHLKDEGEKEIIISDDGIGMDFTEINEKFLRIGRNRRNEEPKSPSERKVIGKKGLGKLSFFGIAQKIEVQTIKENKRNTFVLDWQKIVRNDGDKERTYEPDIIEKNVIDTTGKGTKITLKSVKRISDFNANSLADSLSKIFIIDSDFKIYVKHNNDEEILIENKRKYANLAIEIEWNVPEDIGVESEYEKSKQICGKLLSTEKPISPNTNMRGITLFSRKKLVNLPEYFSDNNSSHFYSYITGWLEVNFIDEIDEDVIGTSRQSLNWGHPEMVKLREYLQKVIKWLERDWREKRKEIRNKSISEKTGVNIPVWYSKMPNEIQSKVKPIIETIVKDSELSEENNSRLVQKFHELIPEYPYYHWRHLHPKLQEVSKSYYVSKDYYNALFESTKKYVDNVQEKSGLQLKEGALLGKAFCEKNPALLVTKKFKRSDGKEFKKVTKENIEKGHAKLALAIWEAFRCPIAHEEIVNLNESGLFTENDCLDALSLLSHLFYRLDEAEKVQDCPKSNS